MRSIRIVTINTAKGDHGYASRIGWLGRELAGLRPDIVLLQEVLVTLDEAGPRYNTLQFLATAVSLNYTAFAAARRKRRLVEGKMRDSYSGLGILSRFPVLESTIVQLPAPDEDGERICQMVVLDLEPSVLLVGNLHLTHLRDESAGVMRRDELETTLRHPWWSRAYVGCLLGGDFNTPLAAMPALIGNLGDVTLMDTWVHGSGDDSRATVPAANPTKCLDYILSVARDAGGHGSFRDARTVLGSSNHSSQLPSDHRGVMVTLDLPHAIDESRCV